MQGLRGIIKWAESDEDSVFWNGKFWLPEELVEDKLKELDKDIEYVWKRKHNLEGQPSAFNLGYMGACWDIQGPEAGNED